VIDVNAGGPRGFERVHYPRVATVISKRPKRRSLCHYMQSAIHRSCFVPNTAQLSTSVSTFRCN
jgi:hypothetical protein